MQKLLIADSSDIFSSALRSALAGQFQVVTCADGKALMQLLTDLRPDVLVVNLMLPYKDGLTALQESAYHPPVILAITMHMSAYVEHSIASLGIDYTMIAPSVSAVVTRLQDILKPYIPRSDTLELRIQYHLHMLNFPTHLDGYHQLCLALPIFVKNPQQLITKELYPAVAELSGCKDSRSVEHSIRKAIQAAWKCRDNAQWRKYFPIGPQGIIPCPTNKEFICRLAEILQIQPASLCPMG